MTRLRPILENLIVAQRALTRAVATKDKPSRETAIARHLTPLLAPADGAGSASCDSLKADVHTRLISETEDAFGVRHPGIEHRAVTGFPSVISSCLSLKGARRSFSFNTFNQFVQWLEAVLPHFFDTTCHVVRDLADDLGHAVILCGL